MTLGMDRPILALQYVPMSAIGDEIRRERRARGMSQEELAKATGTGQRTIGRLERGEAGAEPRTLERIQSYLRVGPYKPERGASDDPPLSQATFAELVAALVHRHGIDVREAQGRGRVRITTGGDDSHTPGGERLATGWDHPDEGDTAS